MSAQSTEISAETDSLTGACTLLKYFEDYNMLLPAGPRLDTRMQRIRGVQVRAPQRIAARSTACVSPVEEQASLWRLARPDDEDESSSHASCSSDQHRSMNVSWNRLERMWNYDEKSIDIETLMATSPIASASQASAVEEKPPPTVPPQPGGPNKGGDGGKSPDYYANVGDAIRTLRDDIPRLFERDINCESHPH